MSYAQRLTFDAWLAAVVAGRVVDSERVEPFDADAGSFPRVEVAAVEQVDQERCYA